MPASGVSILMHHVHRLLGARRGAGSDAPLLDRFAQQRDSDAFTVLMGRYGSLVWSACRRVTENEQDAEDVFQATFLLLAQKAATIRKGRSVGSWLFGVAHRLALRSRSDASRRRAHEGRASRHVVAEQSDEVTLRELRTALDEELARLPDKYRAPLLLCYLEELTQEEAAARLGWSKRLVKYRLECGRRQLRRRLARRGLTLAVALTGAMLALRASAAVVPAALVASTLRSATALALGEPLSGVISARVLALTEGGLKAMTHSRLWTLAAGLLALAALAGGAGLVIGYSATASAPEPPGPAAEKERVDLLGDPLPAGAVTRLGTVRFRANSPFLVKKGLAFMPDGKTIVSVDEGRLVQFWDATTGKLLRDIKTDIDSMTGFALSSDGKCLAAGGYLWQAENAPPRGTVGIWDVSSGKHMRSMKRDAGDVDGCSLVFSPDNKFLVSVGARSGKLRIEEAATGEEILLQQFPSGVGSGLAISPDGLTLAVSMPPNARRLYLWKWQSGEEPQELKVRDRVGDGLAFSPDGKKLAESGDNMGGNIRVWDVATRQVSQKLAPPETVSYPWLGAVAYAPDGKTLLVTGYTNAGGVVLLWDAATGRYRGRLNARTGVLAVAPDSELLAVRSNGLLGVWNLRTGKEVAANDDAHTNTIYGIGVTEGQVVTAGEDHTIRVWDAASGKQKRKLEHDGSVRAIALSPDGTQLISSALDDSVCLWDLATGKRIYKLPGHGKWGGRRCLGFLPDGKHFLSWGDDFYLRKWDVATGKLVLEHRLQPTGVKIPDEDADDIEWDRFMVMGENMFSRDGKVLVLSTGNQFHVFDVATGKDLRQIASDGAHEVSVALSPDGKLLLASAWGKPTPVKLPDGSTRFVTKNDSVCLWELATGNVLQQVPLPAGGAGPVAFSTDGKHFAAASHKPEDHIRLFDTAEGKELGVIQGYRGSVRSLAFTPDGKRLISGMSDTTALVWDLPNKR
jgi:RNA polymerase sigma factor (sigma-70 family)